MATKKKTEEVVDEVKEVETVEATEEAPKKSTKKKSTKKTEEVVEATEAPVEAVKEPEAEVEVVGKKVAEVVNEPVKEESKAPEVKNAVEPKAEASGEYFVKVVSSSGIFTFKNPGLDQPKGKVYPKGSMLKVTEVKGNWAKVGENKWIVISGAVVEV